MGPVEKLLREAGALMRDESKRCAGYTAVDQRGDPVPPHSMLAVCWCAEGAVYRRPAAPDESDLAFKFLLGASAGLGCAFVADLNDNHPKLIDDMFSEAIEAAHVLESEGHL